MQTRSKVLLETLSVVVAGALVRVVAGNLDWTELLVSFMRDRRSVIYPALVGLTGSLLGFVIASLTIIVGYADSPRLATVRSSSHWQGLFDAFTTTMRWVGYSTLLSVTAMLFDRETAANLALEAALLGTLGASTVTVIRMLWVLHRIVRVITGPTARPPGT